jgi:hypothetical protein
LRVRNKRNNVKIFSSTYSSSSTKRPHSNVKKSEIINDSPSPFRSGVGVIELC